MIPSVLSLRALATLSVAGLLVSSACAQDAVQNELKALRDAVDKHEKQIESLYTQIAKLNARLDASAGAAPANAGVSPAAKAGEGTEFAVATPASAQPPKPANVHIVVKGESLEKIAKTNNTTAAELQKINRIPDPKKLQIGQQLVLPITTPKKETE